MKPQKKSPKKETGFTKKTHLSTISSELKKWINVYSLLLFIVPFIIYSNTLKNGYVLDDFSVIKENNIVIQGIKGIPLIWKSSYRYGYLNVTDGLYRPLTLSIFALEWQFFPNKPGFAHFINILIFSLCMVWCFRFFTKLLKSEWIIPLFFCMLLFAVHPIHTEVVGNIKSLDEIMCFWLCLISISLLIKSMENKKIIFLIISLITFFLALLFKESAILLLALLPIFLWYFTEINPLKILIKLLPYFLPLVLYFIIRRNVLGSFFGLETVSLIDNLLIAASTLQEKVGTIFYILVYYIKIMLAPFHLLYNYSYNQIPIVNFSNIVVLCSLLLHIGLFALGVASIKKRKIWGFGIWFLFAGLGLYSNLFATIGAAMGERFYYFSSFGFIWFAIFGVFSFWDQAKKEFKINQFGANQTIKFFSAFLILTTIAFSFKTYSRNKDWKDNLTLYRSDMPLSNSSSRSHYYLGNELVRLVGDTMKDTNLKTKYLSEAEIHLKKALEIIPNYNDAITQLGVCYYRMGNFKEASTYYELALKNNPNDAISINNLAAIYFGSGKYEPAIGMYRKAIELNPRFADAWVNIGSCLGMLQRYEESIEAFKKAIELDPSKEKAYFFLSKSYGFLGNKQMESEYLKMAQQINPSLK